MHCVQGTPGAELVPRLAEAITDSDGSVRDRVLDFCVVDTANNLATALPHAKVSILLDMCRPAFLDGAFFTPPDAFLKRATHKVTLVSHKRSFPRPRPPSKTRRYGFRSKSPHSPRR